MLDFIDSKRQLLELVPIYEKLSKGYIDVQGALNKGAKTALAQLMGLMVTSPSDKVKLDAAKHWLSLSGFNPSMKLEVGRIDPTVPKEALLAEIAGKYKILEEEGIVVEDDREVGTSETETE